MVWVSQGRPRLADPLTEKTACHKGQSQQQAHL